MRAESVAKSIQMLKGVLDGKTYMAIAHESGLSRSAVEQRVKALARDLETVVGVERVDEYAAPSVNAMRARKDDYLEALEHYHPQLAADTGKTRPLFFVSTKVVAAIDAYLDERVRRGQGTQNAVTYRGLDPESRLFLTGDGHAMPINVRTVGNRRQYRCGVILDIYRRIFARAGLKGVSALSARRMIVERLVDRGCDVNQVGTVLGLTERNSVRNLIANEPESLKPLKTVIRDLL